MMEPFYQYRLFAPINDNNNMHVFTNTNLTRLEAELKTTISPTLSSKAGFSMSENGNFYNASITNVGSTSNTSAEFTHSAQSSSVKLDYVQGVTPFMTLGGSLNVNLDIKNTTPSVPTLYGSIFSNETALSLLFDGNVSFFSLFIISRLKLCLFF